jgi:hypothetical protein
MQKKIYHILFAALLFFATTGTGISRHYCGELWVSTTIFGEADACCNKGNCCHTENEFFQVEDDFLTSGFLQIPHAVDLNLLVDLFMPQPDWHPEERFANLIIQQDLHPPSRIHTLLALKQAWLL